MYSTIGTICCRTQFEDTAEFPTTEGTLVADRYRIESFLGSAAFSNCVRATDLNAQKSVCLKIIKNAQNSSKDNFDQVLQLRVRLCLSHGSTWIWMARL
jgi:hypothetical protein|eukprot:SAG25_NODE_9_length_28981_cov_95.245274_17_plen_99_part_00